MFDNITVPIVHDRRDYRRVIVSMLTQMSGAMVAVNELHNGVDNIYLIYGATAEDVQSVMQYINKQYENDEAHIELFSREALGFHSAKHIVHLC